MLLVQDDDLVRSYIRSVLEREGYEVHLAQDTREALALAEQLGPSLDLLITDVIMPG
ncbi:MAG: response regulator, partial [Acidobacteriota bacterium]